MLKVEMYCDGSCLGNPGPGGWAYLLRTTTQKGVAEKEGSGGEIHTTNNKMELRAAMEGLLALKKPCEVRAYVDSAYVKNGMTTWIHNWRRNGFKNAKGKPVENQDLWQRLTEAAANHQVEWIWVKAHDGHVENERVDELARAVALQISTEKLSR